MPKANPNKKQNPTLPTPPKKNELNLVVNDIRMVAVDLTPKDIGAWRDAQKAATSVYYPNRTRLYDLYENILVDGHLSGIIGKRIDDVLNKELFFEDANGKKVALFDDLIQKNERFNDFMELIAWTPLWGISGAEFIPGAEFDFKEIPRKNIKPKWGIIAYDQSGQEGVQYNDVPNIMVMGKPDDVGLLLKCAPYAIYKRGNMADWSQYIEIFGQPVRVMYYDAHDTQTKIELKQVLNESGSSLALMVPKQAEFQMMDGKQSNGDGKLQDTFKNALNEEMSVVILGNTETTTSNKTGSFAKSKVHQDQQLGITKRNMKYTLLKLNNPKFLAILKSYGFPTDGGRFKFAKEVDMEQVKSRVQVIKDVKEMGVPVDDDYVYEVTGIPKPDNYDRLKAEEKKGDYIEYEEEAEQTEGKNEPQPKRQPKSAKAQKQFTDKPAPNLSDRRSLKSAWYNLRQTLADFFDPPRS